MGDQDIEIRFKRAVFLDGSMVIVHRMEHVEGDKPKVKLIMELSPFMVRFTHTEKKELVYEPNAYMPQSTEGFVVRQYDYASLQILSDNPEFPVILMCCTFKGDPPNLTSPNLALIMNMINQNTSQTSTITSLRRTIASLERELDEQRKSKDRKEQPMSATEFMNVVNTLSKQPQARP